MSLLLRPIQCSKVLLYIVRDLNCEVTCDVSIQEEYTSNIVFGANMSNDLTYDTFQCDDALFGFSALIVSNLHCADCLPALRSFLLF